MPATGVSSAGPISSWPGPGMSTSTTERATVHRTSTAPTCVGSGHCPRSGYTRRGYTLDDLLNHPAIVMHELDNAVRRAHRSGRLRRWRRRVETSTYSESGRARLFNRWRRSMGLNDWS
jgi:hypothetical protein